jgi:predicted nucleic acid-binding protein
LWWGNRTSALVKLYVFELGTERLLGLAASDARSRFAILAQAQVEFRAAIRRQRKGKIPDYAADKLIESFRRHSEGKFLIQSFSDSVLDIALVRVDSYALKRYDAVQLAGYLLLGSISGSESTFVCAAKILLSAAPNERVPDLGSAFALTSALAGILNGPATKKR